MQHASTSHWLKFYRIFRSLMLLSLMGFWWYHAFWLVEETVSRSALVIPFIPAVVPFLYRAIFQEEQPRHLILYMVIMVVFLLMEGVLFWPFTLFGLVAMAGTALLSGLITGIMRWVSASSQSVAATVFPTLVPTLPSETGFQVLALQRYHSKAQQFANEERRGEEQLAALTHQWKQAPKQSRERIHLEVQIADLELQLAHHRLLRRFYAHLRSLVQTQGTLPIEWERLEARLAHHLDQPSKTRLLTTDLQQQLIKALEQLAIAE